MSDRRESYKHRSLKKYRGLSVANANKRIERASKKRDTLWDKIVVLYTNGPIPLPEKWLERHKIKMNKYQDYITSLQAYLRALKELQEKF